MVSKRNRRQRNCLDMVFALEKMKTEQKKGRDKTMLKNKTEYRQEVKI